MTPCPNPGCKKAILDDYVYCPYCGTDTRPAMQRLPAPHHNHEYIQGGLYCWKCGLPDQESEERKELAKRGKNFVMLGALCLAIALICSVVSSGIDQSNFNQMMEQRRQLEREGKLEATGDGDTGPTFKFSPIGSFVYLFGVVGAGFCVYGAFVWINSRQERWSPD
ncbi:MAG: hypothetical protein JSS66_01745 [Armatimonadetes bacterium]|nr:hypothetical protein [Armatimonadota bacterium]